MRTSWLLFTGIGAVLLLAVLGSGCGQARPTRPGLEFSGLPWFKDVTEESGLNFVHEAVSVPLDGDSCWSISARTRTAPRGGCVAGACASRDARRATASRATSRVGRISFQRNQRATNRAASARPMTPSALAIGPGG